MNGIKHTLLISLLCLLASCGAYFVDTGNLKHGHVEGTGLLGKWSDGKTFMMFHNGSAHADRFCFIEDKSRIKGDAYIIPITGGHMVILSDFTGPVSAENRPLLGEYIMLLAETPNGSRDFISPFNHIEEGDFLPFATHCPVDQVEGTLSESGFIPYCLKLGTTAEEITTWARNQNQITVEATLKPKPAADIPPFCQD